MMQKSDDQSLDKSILLALLTIFFFASPFTQWWGSSDLPWLMPYLVWLLIIALGALVARKGT
jgi:hypothetical protein